ncbi:MAG: DUF2723 domain-containing protein [Elusimicrobiota bacterium]
MKGKASLETLCGRAVFLGGLAAWLRLSWARLPYGYHDVHYLASLEWGLWGPSEWVHPLFTPLLAFYRGALALFGWHGRMFLPLELLNVAAGAATLALLFRCVERWNGRSLVAAAGALLLGFSRGFWEATLRPDPYALAGLCVAACLALLASEAEDLPQKRGRRFGAAGLAAGLAAGFHVAAISLVPVALAAGWRRRSGWRPLAWFAGGMALCLGLAYGAFLLHHRVTPEYFQRAGGPELFDKIEQMPGTSLWTSRDPLKQARDYWNSLNLAGGSGLLPAAGLLLVLLPLPWFLRRPKAPSSGGPSSLLAWVAGANLASFSLFFLVNNSQNGFVYAGLLGMPLLLAAWAPGSAAWVLVAAALAGAALGSRTEFSAVPWRDPMLVETRFLDNLLRKGDVMVVPGCPFPEMVYERRFNFIAVGGGQDLAKACVLPLADPKTIVGRVAWALRRGRQVFLAPGDLDADFNAVAGDVSGAQKLRQVFWTPDTDVGQRRAAVLEVRRVIDASFTSECGLSSPQGWRYCRLGLKPGRARTPGEGAPLDAPAAEDVEVLSRALLRQEVSLAARLRTRFLLGWLSEAPDDPYARRDLALLAADELDLRGGLDLKDAGRVAALVDALALKRPSDADRLVDRAELYADSGRREDAARALAKARGRGLSPLGLRRAAWCYQGLDDCASALVVWRELAAGRASAKDLSDKAVCEFRLGNRAAAVADLEAAIALDAGSLEAYVSLAAVHAKAGEHRRALEVYDLGLAVRSGKGAAALRRQLIEGRDLTLKRIAEAP